MARCVQLVKLSLCEDKGREVSPGMWGDNGCHGDQRGMYSLSLSSIR